MNYYQDSQHQQEQEQYQLDQTAFVPYEQLQPLQQSENPQAIYDYIMQSNHSNDWTAKLYCLVLLRRVHKQMPQEINQLFNTFGEFIQNQMQSNKTKVQQNIIAFTQEIIGLRQSNGVQSVIVENILWLLLGWETLVSKLMQQQYNLTIEQIIQSFINENILKIILGKCLQDMNKRQYFIFLLHFVQVASSNIALISQETASDLFTLLGLTVTQSKNASSKTDAKNIAVFLMSLIGQQNYYAQIQVLFQSGRISFENKRELEGLLNNMQNTTKQKSSLRQEIYNQENQTQFQKFSQNGASHVQVFHK